MDTMQEVGKSSADHLVALVSGPLIDVVWPSVELVMKAATRGGTERWHAEDFYLKVKAGELHLWVGMDQGLIDHVGFCRLETYRNEIVYRVVYAGGAFSKYMPESMIKIEQFACFSGATSVACDTRPGMARRMTKFGYGISSYELKKTVNPLWQVANGR